MHIRKECRCLEKNKAIDRALTILFIPVFLSSFSSLLLPSLSRENNLCVCLGNALYYNESERENIAEQAKKNLAFSSFHLLFFLRENERDQEK